MTPGTDRISSAWAGVRLFAFSVAAALMLTGCVTGQGEAPLVRDGAFETFTVYTDDGRNPADFSPDVILLLHGYQSAMPNDDYDAIVALFGDTHTIVGFNYDYTDIAADKRALDELFAHYLADRRVIVLGTSLGGFWAEYVLTHHPVAGAILVNPALQPGPVLRDTIGTHQGDRRQAAFTVTEADAAAYDAMASDASIWSGGDGHGTRLVLLSDDDEVIDPTAADGRFAGAAGTAVMHFETGGHNLPLDRPDVVHALKDFVARVAPGGAVQGRGVALNRTEPYAPISPSPAAGDLRPGLDVDYYYAKMNSVDALRGLIRSRTGEAGAPILALNYVGNEGAVLTSSAADLVGARIRGMLKVTEPGTHFFRVTSNDGVELRISGQLLHADPKVHPDRASPILGADFPEAGYYPVEILYFEKKGTATLKLEWRPPGAKDLTVIPAGTYLHLPVE